VSSALDSFLGKWQQRWPEWAFVERFVAEADRTRAVAWFALLQELDDMLNISGDPLPSNAKLGWWGEELRSWAGQRSRHPLGRVLEPVRAPWMQLAEALPELIEAREPAPDPAQARRALQGFAEAVAAVEASLFDAPLQPHAAGAVLTQVLAQRVQELGTAVVPAGAGGEHEWQQALLAQWPARVAGPRPRRLLAALARGRLQARLRGGGYQPSPAGLLWRAWCAARG
jgi:phytoene/squalene synthetase